MLYLEKSTITRYSFDTFLYSMIATLYSMKESKFKSGLTQLSYTRLVRDTKSLINTLEISQSVTAPYKENVPVA